MNRGTALVVATLAAIAACQEPSSGASTSAPEIVSTGAGEVRVPPDRAELALAVVTRGSTAAQAGRANADRLTAVLAALRRQSVPDSAISTAGYSVSQEEDYGETSRRGPKEFVARNQVGVRLANLPLLGALIDTALAAGATEVAGIVFRSSRESEARTRAIDLAVQKARAEAEAAASSARRSLGGVIEIVIDPNRASAFGGDVMNLEAVRVRGATVTPMMPSDIAVRVQVRVRSALSGQAP